MAATFKATNWPPRSPHEALLSSPSGRKKLSQRYAQRSTSPSPVKRQPTLGLPEVEEDEETLKLELKRIEAKLKLKKLQAQAQSVGYSGSLSRNGVAPSQPQTKASSGGPLTANTNRREARDKTRPQSQKLQDQSETRGYAGRLNRGAVESSQSRTGGNSSGSASSTSNTNRLEGRRGTNLQSRTLQSQSQTQTSGYNRRLNRTGVEPPQSRTREHSSASSTANTSGPDARVRTHLHSQKPQPQSQTSRFNRPSMEPSQSRTRTNSNGPPTANANRLERRDRSRPQTDSTILLQVPVSPPHSHIVTQQPRSPGRVLLGIDKGLKGKDVSLRRAPYLKSKQQSPRSSNHNQRRTPYTTATETQTKTKTFSERMAELKAKTNVEKRRADEHRMNRSKGFSVDRKELEELKRKANTHSATSASEPPRHTRTNEPGFSREEILKSYHKPTGGLLHRETTASGARNPPRRTSPPSTEPSYRRSTVASEARKTTSPPTSSRAAKQPSAEPADGFDKHSALHLSKRILPEAFLARALRGKKILRVPDLLRGDDAHDDSADIVVMGVIASKSAPRDHASSRPTTSSSTSTSTTSAPRGKYMALTLTDLKWEVTLFLFGAAFRRFWKLTPGTVVAVLNPTIMPARASDPAGAAPSLALDAAAAADDDDDNSLLELGTARDLGYCASVRRDGRPCAAWIDARHTAHCAFHVDRQVDRTRAGRMEVNSVPRGAPCGGRAGGFVGRGGRAATTTAGLRQEGPQYDRGTASRFFVAGRSAAALLDEGEGGGVGGAEKLRLRLAAREKEREVARRLGAVGGGVGGEYLSRVAGGVAAPNEDEGKVGGGDVPAPRPDARSLGLVRRAAAAVTLSPAKKRGRGEGSGEEEVVGGKGRKRGRWGEKGKEMKAAVAAVAVAEGDEEDDDDDVDYFLEMAKGRIPFSSGESDGLEIV